jgi:ribosomal protein L11 methylase PrmA
LIYTVEQILIEYARVATVENNMSSIQSSLEHLKLSETNTIHLNIEKMSKYQKDRASALSYICRSLNDNDEALFDEYNTAQQTWKYVKSKYTRVSTVTANTYITKI